MELGLQVSCFGLDIEYFLEKNDGMEATLQLRIALGRANINYSCIQMMGIEDIRGTGKRRKLLLLDQDFRMYII